MVECQGPCIADRRGPWCWRLGHVQASVGGCMAAERRSDEQKKQQQQIVLDYAADGGCDVVGLGDTWLGDDASEVSRVARAVMGRANDESVAWRLENLSGQQPAIARAQHGMATQASWQSAGSHKDENHIWRGGASAAPQRHEHASRPSLRR